MEPNVVSDEYLILQKGIIEHQKKLKNILNKELSFEVNQLELKKEVPVLSQMKSSPVTIPSYRRALETISDFLVNHNSTISQEYLQLVNSLSDDIIIKWMKASITFDIDYFTTFSQKNNVDPSLTHFIAEQALRPFLQVLGEKCESFIEELDVMGTCPCCGEPPRLAILHPDGEKDLYCPRCESKWQQKKLECVHCGDDRHENLFYITIEEDTSSKLEVCKLCRNYIKIVFKDKMSEAKQGAMLELETLHLDFVAQQEGFGEATNG